MIPSWFALRRRRAQASIETSIILVPLVLFVFGAAMTFIVLFRSWSLGQVVTDVGQTYMTSASWNDENLISAASGYGLTLSETNDSLTIEVVSSDGSALCAAPAVVNGAEVCTYGWGTDPADGPQIEYGDFVSIKLVTNENSSLPFLFPGFSTITAEWSGIAQRDTGSGEFTAPETSGDLTVTVRSPSDTPIAGALVTLGSGVAGTTGAGGQVAFSSLIAGDYLIGVSATGYQDTYSAATVTVGATGSVTVTMSDALYLNVYLASGPVNILPDNGDLEDGDLSSWSSSSSPFITAPASATLVSTAANVHDGSYAIGFTTDDQGSTLGEGVEVSLGAVSSQDGDGDGTPDLAYYASAWIKGAPGSPLEVVFGSPGSGSDVTSVEVTATGGWQLVSISWVPSEARIDAVLAVRDGRVAGNAVPISVYVDDVIVRTGTDIVSGATVTATFDGDPIASLDIGNGLYRLVLISDYDGDGTADSYTVEVTKSGCTSPSTPFSFSGLPGETATRLISLSCSP